MNFESLENLSFKSEFYGHINKYHNNKFSLGKMFEIWTFVLWLEKFRRLAARGLGALYILGILNSWKSHLQSFPQAQ